MTGLDKARKALERAEANAKRHETALRYAAIQFARDRDTDAETWLYDAAKAATNARHQVSRCRKHVRDAGGEA